jgi:hypothetical protein
MTLVGLLIFVVIVALVFYVLSVLPLGQPWKNIITVIVCVIILVFLLQALGVIGGGPLILHR